MAMPLLSLLGPFPVLPEGSKDPDNGVLGPKYYDTNGIWAKALLFGSLDPRGGLNAPMTE